MVTMPMKSLSIHLTFWGSNSGNVEWMIRHNPKRYKKLCMAHTTRPGKLIISGLNTLQMKYALSTIQRLSKFIAIMLD